MENIRHHESDESAQRPAIVKYKSTGSEKSGRTNPKQSIKEREKMKEIYNITKDGGTAQIEEATPTDSHKSFYGKAKVYHLTNGGRILESYATPVIYEAPTGELHDLWGGWSATTGRHIASVFGLNKKEVEALPNAHADYFHNSDGDLIVEKITIE